MATYPSGRELAFRIPERIEAEIVALGFAERGIGLNAEWIDEELVPALAGAVGIEEDADHVVAHDVFALGHAGARLSGRRIADEDGVKVLIVVADPGRGLAADRNAVAGLALAEIVDALHVAARCAAEELLEPRRAGQFWDMNISYLRGAVAARTVNAGTQRVCPGTTRCSQAEPSIPCALMIARCWHFGYQNLHVTIGGNKEKRCPIWPRTKMSPAAIS